MDEHSRSSNKGSSGQKAPDLNTSHRHRRGSRVSEALEEAFEELSTSEQRCVTAVRLLLAFLFAFGSWWLAAD